MQVLTDRQFSDLFDVVFGKLGLRSNTREHEELWSAKGATADDDFFGGRQTLTVGELNAGGLVAFEKDALDNGICYYVDAFEIVANGGVLAGSLMPVLDQLGNAVGVAAIHVWVKSEAGGQESFLHGLAEGIVSTARGSVYGA